MKQHQRRLAWLAASSALTLVGVLAACSSDGTVPIPGDGTFNNVDSGKKTTSSSSGTSGTSGNSSGSSDDDDDTVPLDAAGVDCGNAPRLHATTAGFYCAFFKDAGPDSGGAANCANNETCCNPGKSGSSFPPSYCALGDKGDNGTANCDQGATDQGLTWVASGATTWECGASTNCGGSKCCAFSVPGADAGNQINVGKDVGTGAPPAACGAQYVYKIGGTKCSASCAQGEYELCSSTDNCSDPSATCTPAGTTGSRELGVCITH